MDGNDQSMIKENHVCVPFVVVLLSSSKASVFVDMAGLFAEIGQKFDDGKVRDLISVFLTF